MKSNIGLSVMLIALLACGKKSEETRRTIIGEWDSHSTYDGKPWHFLARFKPDGIIDGIGNGKLIISMNYRVSGDTIYFTGDPSCVPNSVGSYKLTYFQDSVRLDMVDDTCNIRIANTDKVRLGRVNAKGPAGNSN